MADLALVPQGEEEARLLQEARGEVGIKRPPQMPQLRMYNVKAKENIPGVELGEWFIDEYVVDETTKKGEKIRTPLGAHPSVLILKARYSYKLYDKDADRLVGWTNELDPMDRDQLVRIVYHDGNEARVIATLTKREFKDLKDRARTKSKKLDETLTLEEKIASRLKYTNVIYVYLPEADRGLRLIVSNASGTGVPDGEAKFGSFDDPQPLSFSEFKDKMTAERPEVLFKHYCILGSRKKLDVKGELEYYLMQFEAGDQVTPEVFSQNLRRWKNLGTELEMREELELLSLGGDANVHDVEIVEDEGKRGDGLPDL